MCLNPWPPNSLSKKNLKNIMFEIRTKLKHDNVLFFESPSHKNWHPFASIWLSQKKKLKQCKVSLPIKAKEEKLVFNTNASPNSWQVSVSISLTIFQIQLLTI